MRAHPLLPVLLLSLAACSSPQAHSSVTEEFSVELPPGELGLVPLPAGAPAPDYSIAWRERHLLMESIENSLGYLAAPSSHQFFPYGPISHRRMQASLERFYELLTTATSAEDFRKQVIEEFEVWMARGSANSGEVLFTGYCRPLLHGAYEKGGPYQHPLYRLPNDLVKGANGEILGRQGPSGAIVPYYTAGEIRNQGHLEGQELLWLDSAFDAYIAVVQGSAVVELPGGERVEIGYAGNNGHPYVSVGKILVDENKIPKDLLSLTKMKQYFRDHPGELGPILDRNPRYVFFQESQGGPYGSLGQPVLPKRSVATDKDVFPRAGLIFCEVRLPEFSPSGDVLLQRPERFFTCDQDRGGAIRSAGRCDVFLGTGDRALARAGHVFAVGRLYYLFLKGLQS
ncbi:MAG: hypothetical protein DWQ01_17470 [Planctomycetota bacterium]|nr:MAG: hypothetical protein DWQ01_17470 [Planctomycetota bacterium]